MYRYLFKQKNYMLFLSGKLISLLGSNIQQFVLSLYVLMTTGSATIFASMLAISIFPRLLLSPIAGVFGDWFDRKKVIVSLDLLNAILLAGFALIVYVNGTISLLLIYLLVIVLEITEIFFGASMAAILPSIIKEKYRLHANSLYSIVLNVGQLIAPLLGAIIFGWFGLLIALIINAMSFLVSGITEMFMQIPKTRVEPKVKNLKSFKNDLKEGIVLIKNKPLLITSIKLAAIVNFSIASLYSVGLIYIIKEVLKASTMQFGLYQMSLSLSLIVAPILCMRYVKKFQLGQVITFCFFMLSFIVMLMSLSVSPLLHNTFIHKNIPFIFILLLSFLTGIFVSVINISNQTLYQKIVPLTHMSRTSAVLMLVSTISIPIGQMVFGFLYDTINTSYVILINGFILLLAILRYYKPLTKYLNIENEKQNPIKESGALVYEI